MFLVINMTTNITLTTGYSRGESRLPPHPPQLPRLQVLLPSNGLRVLLLAVPHVASHADAIEDSFQDSSTRPLLM